ncbi:MAG: hypothetical protein IJO21_02805 [Oscillospiraceae bacterium]|nr:hypothetical protein [Oscillospiraceae bacterium]
MKKLIPLIYAVLSLAGLFGGILCAVQFVTAIRFGELGRVIVYFFLAVLCLELLAVCVTRLVRMRKTKEEPVQS